MKKDLAMQKQSLLKLKEVGTMNTNKAYLGAYMAVALAANAFYHAVLSGAFA